MNSIDDECGVVLVDKIEVVGLLFYMSDQNFQRKLNRKSSNGHTFPFKILDKGKLVCKV